MFIELVDQLRCPRPHEPTWLVASIDRRHDRDIREGTLGCPVCATRYPIADGVADLRLPERREPFTVEAAPLETGDGALRLAALLDLTEPGGFIVLAGLWGAVAPTLLSIVEGIQALAVNGAPELSNVPGVSVMLADDGLPVRASAARGVALDERHATREWARDSVSALRAGGRLVAPAALPLPDEMALLARDERYWVAERTGVPSVPVRLTRADRPR